VDLIGRKERKGALKGVREPYFERLSGKCVVRHRTFLGRCFVSFFGVLGAGGGSVFSCSTWGGVGDTRGGVLGIVLPKLLRQGSTE